MLPIEKKKSVKSAKKKLKKYRPNRVMVFLYYSLTGSDVHVAADDRAHVVGGQAPVHGAVHVLSVHGRRERQQGQRAVGHVLPKGRHVRHGRPVRRQPPDVRRRVSGRGAVDPRARRVGELVFSRRFQQERRSREIRRRRQQPCGNDVREKQTKRYILIFQTENNII